MVEKDANELLKEISSKLNDVNQKREDRNFQLDMLEVQVRQNNVVFLLTVVASVGVAFLVALLSISFTPNLSKSIFNLISISLGEVFLVFIVVFSVIWAILSYLLIRRINNLRNEVKSEVSRPEESDTSIPKGDRNIKVKVNILGLLSFEQEIKENGATQEKKLQIELSKLQTDVQNWLAISLALFALTGAFVVAEAQNPLSFQGFLFAGLAILFGIFAANSIIKAQSFRKQMNNLH